MRFAWFVSVLAATLAATACGDKPSAPKPAVTEEKSVFDAQLRTLDKAKGVEQTLQQGAEAQRKSIDEAGK